MITKIKIDCIQCAGKGLTPHCHIDECYSCYRGHQAYTLNCNKQEDVCSICRGIGYIVHIGEVLELNPPESK